MALSQFNSALELSPDHPDCLSDRAVAYIHLGKLDLALFDMNLAQKLEPTNPYRYSSRAYLKDRIGDLQGAIEDYSKAIELDPDDAIAYNNLGILEEKAGRIENAKKNFKIADEIENKNKVKEFQPEKEQEKFISIQNENKITENSILAEENDELESSKLKKVTVIKSVFTSKNGFTEFFGFIFRGFKLKK